MNSIIAKRLYEAHKLSGDSLESIMSTYTTRVTRLMDRDRSKGFWVNWLDTDCKYGDYASRVLFRYSEIKYKRGEK